MVENKNDIFIKTGFILSIISLINAFIPAINYLSIVMGILAAILGIVGLCQKEQKSIAVTAIVLGICSAILAYCLMNTAMSSILGHFEKMNNEFENENSTLIENTENILENEIDVEFGDYEEFNNDEPDDENEVYVDFANYSTYKLPVIIKNKSSEMKTFDITIEAIDKNGRRIIDDSVYVNNLRDGQSYKTYIFNYPSDDELVEQLKDATFKVLTASSY